MHSFWNSRFMVVVVLLYFYYMHLIRKHTIKHFCLHSISNNFFFYSVAVEKKWRKSARNRLGLMSSWTRLGSGVSWCLLFATTFSCIFLYYFDISSFCVVSVLSFFLFSSFRFRSVFSSFRFLFSSFAPFMYIKLKKRMPLST